MTIDFREATHGDRDVLLGLVEEYYAFDHIPYERERLRRGLGVLLGDGTLGRAWLIEDRAANVAAAAGAALAGYVILTFSFDIEYGGRDAFVTDLFLRAPHRGRGIGTQAFEFLEARCKDFDVAALHLQVEHSNTAAQAFYLKTGFRLEHRHIMTKQLS